MRLNIIIKGISLFMIILAFIGLEWVGVESKLNKYICLISALYVAAIDPTFGFLLLISRFRACEKKALYILVLGLLIWPVAIQILALLKNWSAEEVCILMNSLDQLNASQKKEQMRDWGQKQVLRNENSRENEGLRIQTLLWQERRMKKAKDDLEQDLKIFEDLDKECQILKESFGNNACEVFNPMQDYINSRGLIKNAILKSLLGNVKEKGCEKLKGMFEKNNPCEMDLSQRDKIKDYLDKKTRDTEASSQGEEDAFEIEVTNENYLQINEGILEEPLSHINRYRDYIITVMEILMALNTAHSIYQFFITFINTVFTLRKFRGDPGYSNTQVTASTFAADSSRNPVLPLRGSDFDRFGDSVINIQRKKTPVIPFVILIAVMFFTPTIHNYLGQLASNRLFLTAETYKDEDMQECLSENKPHVEEEYPYSYGYLIMITIGHTLFLIADSIFGEYLEGYLFTKINPEYKLGRDLDLINRIKHHRLENAFISQECEETLLTCNRCKRYIFLLYRFCEDPGCGNLLCSSCSCH